MLITYYKYVANRYINRYSFSKPNRDFFCSIAVEFEEDEVSRNLEAAGNMKMASNCTSQEAVIDSGVDSEATTPSSPEDDPHDHEAENPNSRNNKSATATPSICNSRNNSIDEKASAEGQQLSDDMVLETAETLLALSGKSKSASNGDTAIVRPRQPPQSPANQGKILAFFSFFNILFSYCNFSIFQIETIIIRHVRCNCRL